jgi:outer membrane protein assembly factor BamB
MDSLTATDMRAIGEFRLLARLGAGGMGQVFLASSLAGRVVAVKVIHAEHCRDPEFVRRFRGEVEAAQRVSGWYTAPVVAAGVDDTPPWLATAFVPGPPLDDIVSRHGPLPVAAVWRLAAGLAEALRAIHGTGLVHRDLKPANVLLAPDGPRVIDFGISRAVADTRLTASGAIIGTPSYMSPEQVEGAMAGPASDVFSLGSVLAYAATGTAPFNGAPGMSAAAVMYRVVHGQPNLEGAPADLRSLIEACLAKDPSQRPDLARVASGSTAAAERLGLSPAAFWPPEVAGVIQAQQAALTEQIAALSGGAAGDLSGTFGGTGAPSGMSTGFASPLPGGTTRPGGRAGQYQAGPTAGGYHGAPAGTTRRGLLIGAAVGGVAVIGGGLGWALSARSGSGPAGTATPPAGSGALPAGLPTASGGTTLSRYYGEGPVKTETWKFATGNAIEANPGAGDGLVYVGSMDNTLYAVSAVNGTKAWTYPLNTNVPPQVVGDVVCVASNAGHVYARNAKTGAKAWDVDTGIPTAYRRPWAVDGGTIILAEVTGAMRAYDAATGAPGLSYSTQTEGAYVSVLTVDGGVLYALEDTGVFSAFQVSTGTQIWRKTVLTSNDQPGTGLTVDGGAIYLGTQSGTMYAVSAATGTVSWTYKPGSSIYSSVLAADGLVYVQDGNGTLHAVDTATRKVKWTRAGVPATYWGPALDGGRLYYTTYLAMQAVEAKTGDPVWRFLAPTGAEFLSTPVITDGLAVFGSSNDTLYAVKV